MLKTIHYVYVFILIIFLGVALILHNEQQQLSAEIEGLSIKFSASSISSLTLTSTISKPASHVAITTQKVNYEMTLTSSNHSGEKIKQSGHSDDSNEETSIENAGILNLLHYNETSTISSDIFSKDSPFYGMLYRDEYGSALRSRTQAESYKRWQSEWELWKSYFPNLMENFQKLEKANPNLNKTLSTRSASVSFNQTSYKFGEMFLATIRSLDGEQRPKQFGGDYYRARLVQKHSIGPSDGIPCKVVDNCDGTYTVTAPLLLKGLLLLEVKLVNSVEAIKYIVMKTENLVTWRIRQFAKLESNEDVTCNMLLSNM